MTIGIILSKSLELQKVMVFHTLQYPETHAVQGSVLEEECSCDAIAE